MAASHRLVPRGVVLDITDLAVGHEDSEHPHWWFAASVKVLGRQCERAGRPWLESIDPHIHAIDVDGLLAPAVVHKFEGERRADGIDGVRSRATHLVAKLLQGIDRRLDGEKTCRRRWTYQHAHLFR